MLGQPASWQTVCSSSLRTSCCSARYSGPIRAVVLIQDGFFSIGTLALRTSSRSILRPSGAMVTGSVYLGLLLAHRALIRRRRRRSPRKERLVSLLLRSAARDWAMLAACANSVDVPA